MILNIGGKQHNLLREIKKGIYNSQFHVVIVKVLPKEIFNENVYMYDRYGDFVWQISKDLVDKHRINPHEPFVNADFDVDGNIILWNWGGWKVTLDPQSGKELSYEFTK